MKLNKIFDENPPFLKELSEGIQFIPIIKIKEALWQDFAKWEDVNFQYTITLRGHDVIVSGSLELVLYYENYGDKDFTEIYRFTGSATFVAESNQNWLPILNSECIKNAVKKLGRKYAMYINQDLQEMEEMDNAPKPKQDAPKKQPNKVNKGIKDIISQTKNS